MPDDTLLEQIGKLIDQKIKPLQEGQERIEKRQESQGILLAKVGNDIAQVLSEQQQQRINIRSVHDDLDRIEQKVDRVAKDVKTHEYRIGNLEEHTGTQDTHKN